MSRHTDQRRSVPYIKFTQERIEGILNQLAPAVILSACIPELLGSDIDSNNDYVNEWFHDSPQTSHNNAEC
jgi:hypothetical protein